jgi:hypothetical protein
MALMDRHLLPTYVFLRQTTAPSVVLVYIIFIFSRSLGLEWPAAPMALAHRSERARVVFALILIVRSFA